MTRTTAIRAFVVGAPLPFAALLTQHPMGGGDLFELVSDNLTTWLTIHYAGRVFFPLMALVVWLLIRDLPGRAATIARWALPVFAVFYTVWEAVFGIAIGLIAQSGSDLSGAERAGAAAAVDHIVASPLFGEAGAFRGRLAGVVDRDRGRDHGAQARRRPPLGADPVRHRRPVGVPRADRPARARLPQRRRVPDRAPPRGGARHGSASPAGVMTRLPAVPWR